MTFEIAMELSSAVVFAAIVVCFFGHDWFEERNTWLLWLVQGLLTSVITICQTVGLLVALARAENSWISLFTLGLFIGGIVSYLELNFASAGSGDDLPGVIREMLRRPKSLSAAAAYDDRPIIIPNPDREGPWK